MKLGPRDVTPLTAKLGSGDPFIQQMMSLLPRLRRFARVLTQANSDADDLVQLTVEKCLRERAQWAEGSRLDSWMFTAMRNAWIDETRMRSRRRESAVAVGETEQVADGSVASEELKVQAMSVRSAMAALPADQRIVVGLVLVDGMSYQEAAELLGIPEGTLTSRLSRARATLQSK